MRPSFEEHKKYRVVYSSNERSNAAPYVFVGDCLGWNTYDSQSVVFSFRPTAGTSEINTRWYNFLLVEDVPKTVPNKPPHKVTKRSELWVRVAHVR